MLEFAQACQLRPSDCGVWQRLAEVQSSRQAHQAVHQRAVSTASSAQHNGESVNSVQVDAGVWRLPTQRPVHFFAELSASPWHDASRAVLGRALEAQYAHCAVWLCCAEKCRIALCSDAVLNACVVWCDVLSVVWCGMVVWCGICEVD